MIMIMVVRRRRLASRRQILGGLFEERAPAARRAEVILLALVGGLPLGRALFHFHATNRINRSHRRSPLSRGGQATLGQTLAQRPQRLSPPALQAGARAAAS